MQRTNIYLESAQLMALDRLASLEGLSRAEVIRRILDAAIRGDAEDPSADLQAIDDSYGALGPRDIRIERSPDARTRHLERLAR